MDRSQDHFYDYTWIMIRHFKAPHHKEHASLPTPCHTGARLLARIMLHVSRNCPNYTPHLTETVMYRARLYKGELASPSRYTSLFTTLLTHSFSVPLLT